MTPTKIEITIHIVAGSHIATAKVTHPEDIKAKNIIAKAKPTEGKALIAIFALLLTTSSLTIHTAKEALAA